MCKMKMAENFPSPERGHGEGEWEGCKRVHNKPSYHQQPSHTTSKLINAELFPLYVFLT